MGPMLIGVPSQIGYTALAGLVLGESAGLPIPGETALITAAGLAAAGTLHLPIVILVTIAAAIVGDTLGYLVGRRGGRRVLLRDGIGATHRRHAVARADRFFARNGVAAVFLGRFVPGVRIVAAVMAGTTRMPWPRFAVANAAGAACWATTIALLAHALGPIGSGLLAVAGLTLGGLTFAVTWWRMRRRSATLPAACAAPSPSARA